MDHATEVEVSQGSGGRRRPPVPDGQRRPLRPALRGAFLNLVLLGCSVLVFLVGGELTLRAFPQLLTEEAALRVHWAAILEGEQERGTRMVIPDPEIGFLYRPDTTSTIDHGDVHFTFTTDDHGFRNPSPWPPSADVVVLGDSMVFGYGLERDQSWVGLMGKALPGASILNLGMIGASPQQYLGIYRRFGVPEHPQLVILMLFAGNDVQDSRMFSSWWESPRDETFIRWRMSGGERRTGAMATVESLLGRSYLFAVLRDSVRAIREPDLAGETMSFPDGRHLQLAPTIARRISSRLLPSNPDFVQVVDTVAEAHDIARRQGSEFLVLLMPTKEHVYLPLVHKPAPPETEPFEAAFEARGIRSLDLTPALRRAAKGDGPLYFDIDGHPNADGSKVIADAVTVYLETSRPMLWPGDRGS